MSDRDHDQTEIVDEMVEAGGGRPRGGVFAWLLAGFVLGAVLLGTVARNPLELGFLEPASSWLSGGRTSAAAAPEAATDQLWTCGMHPTVIQDEPGICPICHMDLTPMGMGGDMDAGQDHDHADGELYTCPMHPQIEDGEPGACPICGMDLVRMGAPPAGTQTAPSARPGGPRRIEFYRNPMDPTVTSPVPMKDSMGMDYVPVYSGELESAGREGAVVTVDAGTVQAMNVVTTTVERGDLIRRIRTVGYLDYDEERMVSVTTKYEGFVEKVHANYLGQSVRTGEALFDVYSPELVQTQEELIAAIDFVGSLEKAPEEARQRAQYLVDAARRRLAYWDVTPEQIRRIEERKTPLRTLTVVSTASGLVMKRMAGLEGMAIKPGMQLLHLADISSLWLDVEIYEDQLSWIELKNSGQVVFPYFPGESFTGRVRYIEPEVQEKTRTVRVTLEIPNRDGRLRKGMYATVTFNPVSRRDVVLVPTEAILRTGERELVVIDLGGGRFAPREIELGASGDGLVEVLRGLQAGERIVTSSQFLIDSESSLREVILKMIAARKAN